MLQEHVGIMESTTPLFPWLWTSQR